MERLHFTKTIWGVIIAYGWLLYPLYAQEDQKTAADDPKEKATKDTLLPQHTQKPNHYFLALEKGGAVKRIRYYELDDIYYKLKNDRTKHNAVITNIGESFFITYGSLIQFDQVSSVTRYRSGWFMNQGAKLFPIAGAMYILMNMFNPQGGQSEGLNLSTSTWIVSSSLVATGLFLRSLRKRTYQLNNRRFLKAIPRF
jgi:hypothetical protein